MIKLRATALHPKRKEGEIYEASAIYAASEKYLGRAVYADDENEVPLARQIIADAIMDPVVRKVDEEMIGTTEVRQKRKYKRRDLTAE